MNYPTINDAQRLLESAGVAGSTENISSALAYLANYKKQFVYVYELPNKQTTHNFKDHGVDTYDVTPRRYPDLPCNTEIYLRQLGRI